MAKILSTMRTALNWGFEINENPISLETSVLGKAQIFDNDKVIHCDEQVLRKLAI